MKIDLPKIGYFFMGCLILIPFSFYFLGTQIFYVQTILLISVLIFFLLVNHRVTTRIKRGSLTLEVLFYLIWVLVSFLLSFLFGFDDLEIQVRRVISLCTTLLLMSSFFIGRSFTGITTNSRGFVSGIYFTYLLVFVYIFLLFISQSNLDLYEVRRIIGQRLPFVIAFVSSLAATYYFLEKPKRIYSLVIMVSGILAVFFSLTRAAYIQIFISFIIIFFSGIKRYFFSVVISFILLSSVAFFFKEYFGNSTSVKQISSRVELLFDYKAQSSEDISGSFRLLMWKFISTKLLAEPVRLLIGYGQLGPTYITKDFVLPDGTSGTSSAHSQYLDIVVREGIIGLFLFLWICAKSLIKGFSIKSESREVRLFVLANSIGLAGILFYSFFHETFRYPLFGFYFWLYLGFLSRLSEKRNI